MKKSILAGKSILAVIDDSKVSEVLKEEVLRSCLSCTFDSTSTFKEAAERLASYTYHLLLLGDIGGRSLDLLDRAVIKNIPVAMLAADTLNIKSLKRYSKAKIFSYLPKENPEGIVPFLEDVLTDGHSPAWGRFIKKLENALNIEFDADLKKKAGLYWQE